MTDSNVVKLRTGKRAETHRDPAYAMPGAVTESPPPREAVEHADWTVGLDDLVQGISDGFALYDPGDRLVVWNEKFASILHYARDLMVPGVSYEALVRKCAFEHFNKKEATFEEKEAWIDEAFHFHRTFGTYERETADGRCFLVSRRRAGEGYTAVVWTDITVRKRTEEALRLSEAAHRELFEGSSQGMVIEAGAAIIKYNRSFAALFGLKADTSFKSSREFDRLAAPHESGRFRQLRRERLAAAAGTSDFDFQAVRGDGKPIWVQATCTAISWQGQLALQTSLQDITQRKEFEEELLRGKLESVAHMAHGIAIEFHKIHNSLQGAIRLAKMEAYAAGLNVVTERLTEAERVGAAASDLVQQLLMLHRGGAPVLEHAASEEILQEALLLSGRGPNVVSLWKDKPNIKIDLGRRLFRLRVDRAQVIGVLRALIGSGLESMAIGGTLAVRAENVTLERKTRGIPLPAGRYVKVEVADQGPGLPEEVLRRIFDPFFRPGQHGAGLGMASAYAVARQHGGTITANSKPGKGTRLCLYLPAASAAGRVKKTQA